MLRNVASVRDRFEIIDVEKCIEEFLVNFEFRLKKANCIFPDYPTVNIKDVFDKYFTDKFPFSKGEKKHEFPDAFALLSVETWCKENNKNCYVFSHDKDLLGYNSEQLIIVKSYEEYLDKKLQSIEEIAKRTNRLKMAKALVEGKKAELEAEIEKWIEESLQDESTFLNYVNYVEIHNIDISDYSAEIQELQFTNVNESTVFIEAWVEIYYDVSIEIDDESQGYYDSEDKEWIFLNTSTEVVEETKNIAVQIKVEVPPAGEEFTFVEITDINKGYDFPLPHKHY